MRIPAHTAPMARGVSGKKTMSDNWAMADRMTVKGQVFGGLSLNAITVLVGLPHACALRANRRIFCLGEGSLWS